LFRKDVMVLNWFGVPGPVLRNPLTFPGWPNCGVFVRLKASARNSSWPTRSMENCLNTAEAVVALRPESRQPLRQIALVKRGIERLVGHTFAVGIVRQ
jgi:hypothetical protein